MFCRNCGEILTETEVVCRHCGFAIGTGDHFCEYCGTETPVYAVVCDVCGADVKRDPAQQNTDGAYQYAQQPQFEQQSAYAQQPNFQQQTLYQQQQPQYQQPAELYQQRESHQPTIVGMKSSRNKATAAILGFILGSLGIHDFYLGNKVKGIIHLGMTISGGLAFVSWIWAIVETIAMLNNPQATDEDGKYLQ